MWDRKPDKRMEATVKKAAEKATKDKRLRGKNYPALCKDGTIPESSPNTGGKYLGTADMELKYQFIVQSWGAMGATEEDLKKEMEKYFSRAHAAIAGINPGNETEAMLAVQMFAAHNMAMEFSRRAMHQQQCSEGVDVNVTRATQFMKIFWNKWSASRSSRERHRIRKSRSSTSTFTKVARPLFGRLLPGGRGRGEKRKRGTTPGTAAVGMS
jgi:hypothetical protein